MCPGLEFADDALADFRYVLEEYPSFVRAHLNVYAIHKRTGNLKDAEWALAQVSWGDLGPSRQLLVLLIFSALCGPRQPPSPLHHTCIPLLHFVWGECVSEGSRNANFVCMGIGLFRG